MRKLAAIGLRLLFLASCFLAVIFALVVATGEDLGTRVGGLVFLVGDLAVLFGTRALLKQLPPLFGPKPRVDPPPLPDSVEGDVAIEGHKDAVLRLSPLGFDARYKRHERQLRWSEIASFKVVRFNPDGGVYGGIFVIGYTLAHREKDTLGLRFSRWCMGAEETVPGLYDRSDEIVALMERYRERYST